VDQTTSLGFRQAGRTALHEDVQDQLRRHIAERGLRPGDRLPTEAELASAVGTSRVVVREALRSLEAVGLVGSRGGSGRYLRPFDASTAARNFALSLALHPTALVDLLTVRRAVETEVAVAAAERMTEADLAALDALVEQMRLRVARGEAKIGAEDAAFHRRIVAASGNLIALALVELFWNVMQTLYARGFPRAAASDLPAVIDTHAEIVAALRRGDGPEASRLLRGPHHTEIERRFAAWPAAHAAGSTPDGVGDVRAAVQAALLWPGIERAGDGA